MKNIHVASAGKYALVETDDPQLLAPTDVIVDVTATTVCGSDVHIILDHMGIPLDCPLGHEFVGVVSAIGSAVTNFSVGDRVAPPAAPWCGTCRTCRAGQIQRCERGGIFGGGIAFGGLGGAMAEKVRVPWADSCLSLIPEGVTDAQALTVGDILSTGWTAVNRAVSAPGQTLVVLGAGPIGLSAVHAARLSGVRQVIVVDTIPARLAVATQLGADRVVDPTSEDVTAVVLERTAGRGAEAIVEAAGVPATIGSWVEIAAIGATVGMVAIPGGAVDIPVGAMQMKNISLWTGLGDLGHMDMFLDLIATGVLDPTPIFTETLPFTDIERAIAEFLDRKEGLIKPLIIV